MWSDGYEWALHAPRALKQGLLPPQVAALRDGRRPEGLDEAESAVFDFAVELLRVRAVADATFERLRAVIGEKGVVDLGILLGNYAIVSNLLKIADIGPPSADTDALPAATDAFGDG